MNPWAWYRNRGRVLKIILGGIAGLVVLVLGYVGIQAIRYGSESADPSVYLPREADIRIQFGNLGDHWGRIQGEPAWNR